MIITFFVIRDIIFGSIFRAFLVNVLGVSADLRGLRLLFLLLEFIMNLRLRSVFRGCLRSRLGFMGLLLGFGVFLGLHNVGFGKVGRVFLGIEGIDSVEIIFILADFGGGHSVDPLLLVVSNSFLGDELAVDAVLIEDRVVDVQPVSLP